MTQRHSAGVRDERSSHATAVRRTLRDIEHRWSRSLLIGFCVSLLCVGVPYWAIPYHKVSLPNALFGAPLLIVGIAAALASAFRAASF